MTRGKNPEPTALPRRDLNRHPDHSQPHMPPSHSQCFPAAFRQEIFETRLNPNLNKGDLDKPPVLDHLEPLHSLQRDPDLHRYLHRKKEGPYLHLLHLSQISWSPARRRSIGHSHRFVGKFFLPALPGTKHRDPRGHHY